MAESSPTVLVVDDNPATLYSTSRVLRSAGMQILEADTGQRALDLAPQAALVVLDVNLPDIDGFEVCRRIRANQLGLRTPVIHLSASFVNDSNKVRGLEAGADGYLTHPVEPPVLIATVNAFLRIRTAEYDVRQSAEKFKAVFNQALNGMSLWDQDLKVLDANPALCQMLLRTSTDVIGQSILTFVAEDFRQQAEQIFKELGRLGKWRGEFPLQRSDGGLVYLEWSIAKHTAEATWLAIVSDITERAAFEMEREQLLEAERSARAEAERANRLKDDFLATLSHELRTPLNAIVGWSHLLKLGKLGPEDTRAGIDAIERNSLIQTQMISDLLDVSRISSGKIRLEVQSVETIEVVESAISTAVPAAQAKGIQLTKILDPNAGPVQGDPSRLQQVIWNLINNAIKFTQKGGKVHVILERVDSHISIKVTDNGRGIDPELLPYVFERFRQGDSPTARGQVGLGLGLAIAKQLVEMHGGTVSARSAGENQGAEFLVLLPISSVQAVRSTSSIILENEEHAISPLGLEGIRILLLDDDADARQLTQRVLADSGAEIQLSANADEAMQLIAEFQPHILISDLGMPQQDGFSFIRQLRSNGYTNYALPAIALTAFARSEDRRRALLAGFQLHLSKPVDPTELSAAIASLVGRTT